MALAVRTVGEYLRRWGYTAKKPARHARRQDPEEVRQWLEDTYPALKARARKEHAEIHWCDETGVVADHCSGYGYARKGQRVTMEVPDPHIGINMVSSITNEGTLRFMTYPGTMTGERFIVFLGRLLRNTTGKIFLIVDRLKVHQSGVVKEWVSAHADRLELFELPRRAPERRTGCRTPNRRCERDSNTSCGSSPTFPITSSVTSSSPAFSMPLLPQLDE